MTTTTITQQKPTLTLPIQLKTAQSANPNIIPGKLRILIDSEWYDLTQWQSQHPGGSEILQYVNGQDATDAFYSLHSEEAVQRLKRLHRVKADATVISKTPAELLKFRQFRAELQKDGWFERNLLWESFYIGSVYLLCVLGTYLSCIGYTIPAILCIGIAMQQAGWIGHDYVHGRGDMCYYAGRLMGGLVNGFSSEWWSHKHNTHHCYTNYMGVDDDIANEPIFHLFTPVTNNDVKFRQYQHLYMVPVYSFLYVSWRIQSIQHAYKDANLKEMSLIVLNYCWLFMLPTTVAIGSILVGGLAVAIVVTASHQSEQMFDSNELQSTNTYNFVRCQFESTRDAITENAVVEWLWGGMQYQLEHHLFPTMPKYRYSKLRPLVQQWAAENNMPYKAESANSIIKRNYETLKMYAQAAPVTTTA